MVFEITQEMLLQLMFHESYPVTVIYFGITNELMAPWSGGIAVVCARLLFRNLRE